MPEAVSAAQKRKLLAEAGEEWPTYDGEGEGGTPKLWVERVDLIAGGRFLSYKSAEATRKRDRERMRKRRREGGRCSSKGCSRDAQRYSTGNYSVFCSLHKLMSNTRSSASSQLNNTRTRTEDLYA